MSKQHEITQRSALLYNDGHLAHPGFSRQQLMTYNRKDIRASSIRIKEWDYYLITNGKIAVALTVADNGYMGLDGISFLSFEGEPWEKTVNAMQLLTLGKKKMPPSSAEGNVRSKGGRFLLDFKNNGDTRELSFRLKGFRGKENISGEITLQCPPDESIVVAIPFKTDEKAFYYNEKKNCMPASGTVTLGEKTYTFDPSDSFAVLDWGRGVWTYENTWYWGSASGLVNGERFGFNIGYGFGDTSYASENMLFYNGKGHKLSKVNFKIPRSGDEQGNFTDEFMEPWIFTSDDGRFEMQFVPILDRASCMDFKFLCSDQHQVFGKFTGTAILDDGTPIRLNDFFGFAEKVYNKW